MIKNAGTGDLEMLSAYLSEEVYGKAILTAIEAYGFDEKFQTVYIDVEDGECKGVYLYLYRSLFLYSSTNKIEIDFLEQMSGFAVPELVAGRKDNVNIVSWLLTEHEMETGAEMPVPTDREGKPVECLASFTEGGNEWAVLRG